jgi:hypothetical protein
LTPHRSGGYISPFHTRRTSEEGRVWKTPIFKVFRHAYKLAKWVALHAKAILQPVRSRTLRTQQRAIKSMPKISIKKSKALIVVVNFNLLKITISFLFYKYL